jgi:predicted dehydrogenase
MSTKKLISRRSFTGTAAGVTALTLVPTSVLPSPNRTAPSDELLFGHIGIGGRGGGFVRPNGTSIALCDVDENRLQDAAKRARGNPKLYTDYRDLLENKDIDAVFIASPDHWHALHTVHACEAGLDVYCEKPACKSMKEGLAMVEAAKRYSRVVQIGSQGRSQEGAYYGKRYINNGQIGNVSEVRCWHYPSPTGNWVPNEDPPENLDYDKWLGPARDMPYNPRMLPGAFRWFMFSGGGQIRDRGAHVMSVATWVMDADNSGPVTVDFQGGYPPYDGIYDTAVHMKIVYEFKNPDFKLIWDQPGEAHEEGFEWPRNSYGANYIGDKGNLIITYGDTADTDTEQKAKDYVPGPDGVEVFHSPGHRENFENCIRTREKPIMHIEAGVKTAALCVLGNIAFTLQRKLEWDHKTWTITNDDQANRMLHRPGRGIYNL